MIDRSFDLRQRLSRTPIKPYIHPVKRENKAMTIGVGFECADGVIMGADRQMTLSGWHNFSGKKLFYDQKNERILALLGGHDLDLAKEFLQKLIGPSVEELGLLFSDNVKLWRLKNQIRKP